MYKPIRGTKMVLSDQEMYESWARENEGRVLLQQKVCISVACDALRRTQKIRAAVGAMMDRARLCIQPSFEYSVTQIYQYPVLNWCDCYC